MDIYKIVKLNYNRDKYLNSYQFEPENEKVDFDLWRNIKDKLSWRLNFKDENLS